MTLKLSEDNRNGRSDGSLKQPGLDYQQSNLRLSGVNNQQIRPNRDDVEKNPWDFGQSDEPVVISNMVETESMQKRAMERENIVLVLGEIAISIMLILEVAVMVRICMQDMSAILVEISKYQMLFGVCQIMFLADAIVVNILYGKKGSLIFLALFFGFLYPMQRNKFVNGRGGTGTLCFFAFLMAMVVYIGTAFEAFSRYGNILLIEDSLTRSAAVSVMDQVSPNGIRYGDQILDCFEIENVVARKQGENVIVAFAGKGNIYYEVDSFVAGSSNSVPTQFAFKKSKNRGTYELVLVILNNQELSKHNITPYWNSVLSE